MTCPKCKSKVEILETVNVSWNEVYRRRHCLNPDCNHQFFTAEFEVEPNKRFRKEWALYRKNRRY